MRKTLWIGLGTLGVALGVTGFSVYRVVTRYVDFGIAAGELPKAVREYRAAGLPFLAREVAPPHLEPKDNPAAAIRAAGGIVRKLRSPDVPGTLALPGPEADAVAARYAKPLALVAAFADRPRVDFDRDWDLGPYILFPEYADMKALGKAAVLRAVRAATKGDDGAALRDLTLARRLGLWADQEPTLISLLVRLALEAIALDGAERCLVASAARPERIARYRRWLLDAPPLPDFGRALRGEMWMGVTTMRNLKAFGGIDTISGASLADPDTEMPRIDPATLRRDGLPDGTRERAFLTRHLQVWMEAYRTTDGFRQSPERIGKRLDAISARIENEKGLSYILERILLPVFGQAGEAVTRLDARRAVEASFADALASHALTGRWPDSVAGKDPFTGGNLRVRFDGKRFRVYSVGRDRKDDGGIVKREAPKTSGATYDEVAAFPAIPR